MFRALLDGIIERYRAGLAGQTDMGAGRTRQWLRTDYMGVGKRSLTYGSQISLGGVFDSPFTAWPPPRKRWWCLAASRKQPHLEGQ